jgi:hypothetical protein
MRITRISPAALALALGLLVAACGGSGGTTDGSTASTPSATTSMSMSMSTAPGARPSTDATLEIVRPTNGETIPGSNVTLKLKLDGGTIATTTSTDLVPDEGHLHVVLDDQLISMTSDLTSVIPDVAPGSHLIKVEFVANDHAPFDPRVIAAVAFEVAG